VANEPTEVHIREQLARLLSSVELGSSPRTQKFLKYVVEQTLNGEAARLKGYAIGVDVFDRGEDFDSQSDTIVRSQARNMRKAMRVYYLTTGKSDPVLIEIRSGSYVPVFSYIDKMPAEDASTPQRKPEQVSAAKQSRPVLVLLMSAIIISLAIGAGLFLRNFDQARVFDRASQMPLGPTIAILPFDVVVENEGATPIIDLQSLKNGLHVELVHKISRFKELAVVSLTGADSNERIKDRSGLQINFILTGNIQLFNENVRVTAVLKQNGKDDILWANSYDQAVDDVASILDIQTGIAVDVASTFGQRNNSINKQFMAESGRLRNVELAHYACLMKFYQYSDRKSEAFHFEVRQCLETATEVAPGFSSGWGALSWMYGDELSNGFNLRENEAPPLQRSVAAAKKGVLADPDNAMAHQYLAVAHFLAGDASAFRQSAKIALQLNPNDAEILADVGSCLIQLDNSDDGRKMVEKAILLNPNHPSWYHSSITMYHYTRQQTERALYHAKKYIENDALSANALLVVVLIQDGQMNEAKLAYADLLDTYPEFGTNAEDIIRSWPLPDGMNQQMIDDLVQAGLMTVE
jgi:TolB-like protein